MWLDVARWPTWDDPLEDARLDPPSTKVRPGARGTLKSRGAPESSFEIVALDEHGYAFSSPLPLGELRVARTLEATPRRLRRHPRGQLRWPGWLAPLAVARARLPALLATRDAGAGPPRGGAVVTPSSAEPPWHERGVVTRRFAGLTVHAVRSGFVACKEAHRTLAVPDFLPLPAIVLDRRWTEWMAVTSYVIEHPEGVFVVDPGQREETADVEKHDCDPGTRWFYRHQLRSRSAARSASIDASSRSGSTRAGCAA